MRRLPAFLCVGVALLAAWLRLWRLAETPPGLWFDESLNGMEVAWMLKNHSWPIFILSGQGREVLFYYLLALSTSLLGPIPYALRLVPALLGTLTVPLIYRWTRTLLADEPDGAWVALLAAAGLAISFGYLCMNRISYRANTLLPVLLMTCYFFWRGRRSGQFRPYLYLMAGLGVGLGFYTYLAGRLVPLIFMLFFLLDTLLIRPSPPNPLSQGERGRGDSPLPKGEGPGVRVGGGWGVRGLLLMALAAALVMTPLALFFAEHPELLWERGGDVALRANTWGDLAAHLLAAGRVFVDGEDPNWRHHLLGRAVFDPFSLLCFWVGLVGTIRHYRRPARLFLLVMLGVMWLPAPLAEPAFHTLRLVGILPPYYVLAGLGALSLVRWLAGKMHAASASRIYRPAALTAILLLSGGLNFYDYFYRWANRPEVYQAFDGPVVELAHYLAGPESGQNVVIPFYLYGHPSLRYVLLSRFHEEPLLPSDAFSETATLVIPTYPPDDALPPALVWLSKERGAAYISAVRRGLPAWERVASGPPPRELRDSRGHPMAHQYSLAPSRVRTLFPAALPQKEAAAIWGDNLRLTGYEFTPPVVAPGDPADLYLSWELLGYTGLSETLFIQLLDSRGNPVGQAELPPLSRKMYRWRDAPLALEQLPLTLAADLEAGLYFARLGFFDPKTGRRLPALTPDAQPLGDQLILGPFYLRTPNANPLMPPQPMHAMLGEAIALVGYGFIPAGDATIVEIYWQSRAPVALDYTVFVQLLGPQNQVVAQVDAQPLPDIYPTSRWQPGDLIHEQFTLPATADQLAAGRLVTGMYDLATGARLPAFDEQGRALPDGLIPLGK